MIKVLYQKLEKKENVWEQPKCIYSLTDINGGIRVTMDFPATYEVKEKFNEITKDYEPNPIKKEDADRKHLDIIFAEHLGHIRNVRVSNDFGGKTLIVLDRFDTAKPVDFVSTGGRNDWYYPVLNFAVNEDASEVILFFRNPTYELEGYDCEKIDVGMHKEGYVQRLMDNSDFCKRKIMAYKSKHDGVITQLDIYDTVAYLESQVDALTRLVLKLASELNNTDEYVLLQEADKYSVMDSKTLENLVKEIKEDKANVRKLQSGFYPEVEKYTN